MEACRKIDQTDNIILTARRIQKELNVLKYIARDQKDHEGEEAKYKERKDVNQTAQAIHQDPHMANESKSSENLFMVKRINGTLITCTKVWMLHTVTEAFIAISNFYFSFCLLNQ